MADKLSDKEIERRKQQAAKDASAAKPHEALMSKNMGKHGPQVSKGRNFRHQGR